MLTKYSLTSFYRYIFIFILLLQSSVLTVKYYPESYYENDLIYPENDDINGDYFYSLIDAKVLTSEPITLYLEKQGIHLTRDTCCNDDNNYEEYNAWSIMNDKSDYEELYTHTRVKKANNYISYDFPFKKIKNNGYIAYHKVNIIDKGGNSQITVKLILNTSTNDEEEICTFRLSGNNQLVTVKITYDANLKIDYASCNRNGDPDIALNGEIKQIKFIFTDRTYSPAISYHWTYYKISQTKSTYTLSGDGNCNVVDNGCIPGYYCSGAVCKQCHPACFDCTGPLSTDCKTKCNTHATSKYPDYGYCNFGYTDLSHYEDLIINRIPPPRNNRLTISFWFFINRFAKTDKNTLLNNPEIYNSLSENANFTLAWYDDRLEITCAEQTYITKVTNTWIYIKCGLSPDSGIESLYAKERDLTSNDNFKIFYKSAGYGGGSIDGFGCGHPFKRYYEEDEYMTLGFKGFSNEDIESSFFIRELQLFREYVPEPYDSKYFYLSNLFTSSFELPEVLFILPFDEMFKVGNNKYEVIGKSYAGTIETVTFTLTPSSTRTDFTLYPPKLFKRLKLIEEKNHKYSSPDLLNTVEIPFDQTTTLLMSDEDLPLTCNKNNFLTFEGFPQTDADNPAAYIDSITYKGKCGESCDENFSTIFGLSEEKGFCNKKCDNKVVCKESNTDLKNIKTTFECKRGLYYDMFYYCEDNANQENSVFYFSFDEKPANIIIDLTNYNLISYIIEFWYFRGDCLDRKNPDDPTKRYIFYCNQFALYKEEAESQQNYQYRLETNIHGYAGKITFHKKEWNHYAFEVFYEPNEEHNKKTRIYSMIDTDTANAEEIDSSENQLPLKKIYFCHGRRVSCDNLDLTWFCGFYKNLRVFNGELAGRNVLFRYDEYYSQETFLLSSIVIYYTLYGGDIRNNQLKQYKNINSAFDTTTATNNWIYPQYNYCYEEAFDYVVIYGNHNQYYVEKNHIENCDDPNCARCFINNKCYKCVDDYFLYKVNGGDEIKCRKEGQNNDYVLILPTDINFVISPNINSAHALTLCFFIKVYGFKISGNIDIMTFSDHMKLTYYSDANNDYFGLNLISYTGTSETVLSNYREFRKHFGLWTFISIATYDKSNENFYPQMIRFEVNQKSIPVINLMSNTPVDKIKFSTDVFALFQRLYVFNRYLIGMHTYISNLKAFDDVKPYLIYPGSSNVNDPKAYFEPVLTEDQCLFSKFHVDGNGYTKYPCQPEYDNYLLKFYTPTSKNTFYPFKDESKTQSSLVTCVSGCDECIGSTAYNCSCNYNNDESKLFLGNMTYHWCKKFTYLNFAKIDDLNLVVSTTSVTSKSFTMHFWAFAYSYVDNVFEGFTVTWENRGKILLAKSSSGGYDFTCYISENNNYEALGKKLTFNMNEWNFLHCAYNSKSMQSYLANENETYTYEKSFTLNDLSGIKLTIKDSTTVDDWGVLFFRYFRLWSDSYKYSSFLSRITIQDNYFGSTLLHQWDTLWNNNKYLEETNDGYSNFRITYNSNKIGTNLVNEEIYRKVIKEPIFCQENGEYYDKKTTKCIQFTDISNTKDEIKISGVDVAYSHNYAMSFWILLENDTDITSPLNFTWQYHMQIQLVTESNAITSYCFPQNYAPYSDIVEGDAMPNDKYNNQKLLNKVKKQHGEIKGIWTWIQCSVSYSNRYFYLDDGVSTVADSELIAETIYSDSGNIVKNDEPLGWFFNSLDSSLSILTINVIGNRDHTTHKKIYLRCFYLFKDYLPPNYDYKYMDLYRVKNKEFPPLTLAINFAEYTLSKPDLKIKYNKFTSGTNTLDSSNVISLVLKDDSHLDLSANFIFLPLCNPLSREKYNSDTNLCEEISDCDENGLNCLYCMGEKKPLICKLNYYINIDSNGDTSCLNYCEGDYYRSPGTHIDRGICGTDCISNDVLMTCPNTASSILNYQDNFACKTGYSRIGYQCFNGPTNDDPNPGALFYSSFNYPYNIYHPFSQTIKNQLKNGYVLEFSFMIDNVINKSSGTTNLYYFACNPHYIYYNNGKYKYYFETNGITHPDITSLIHQYEWNKILIFVDNTESLKTSTIIVNYDKANKIVLNTTSKIDLNYIKFCSKPKDSSATPTFPICYGTSASGSFTWGSAYYNNIRIWDIQTANLETIQYYVTKVYEENPQSLILYYPLTIKYLDNNVMSNIMTVTTNEDISLTCESIEKCSIYNKDNIIIYNYASKFDWGLLNNYNYVNSMSGTDGTDINSLSCDENCKRCYATNDITKCYECKEGYVLQYQECKQAKYYLKTPSGTSGSPINLSTKNDNEKDFCSLTSFTLVFWIKFFGVEHDTISEYCSILTFDSSTYLAFHRTKNNLVLIQNSQTAFTDTNFNDYYGKWIPISIANYISGSQNDIYPNMFTLSVNRIDIPFDSNYKIPDSGIKVTQLQIGYEIIALFAQLSIYSKFIQGAYGRIRSTLQLTDRFYYKSLTGTKTNDCVNADSDLISSVSIICATDFFLDDYNCNNGDITQYFEPDTTVSNPTCLPCNSLCETCCFNGGTEECTCDLTEGKYWLRRNASTKQTYCEHIPYLDFSNAQTYTYTDAPVTKTKEYTVEFWAFVYSYNLNTMNFKELYVEWNYHNRIKLFNEANTLKVTCLPIYNGPNHNTETFPDSKTASLRYYEWNYIRCGTDIKNKKYFLNTNVENDLKAKEANFLDYDDISKNGASKEFKIYKCSDFYTNFGYVFLREIKVWQQYNLDFLDSQYIKFDMSIIPKEDLKKYFPGLLLYYKNDYKLNANDILLIIEEMSGTEDLLIKATDYVGYNIIDPNNEGRAPDQLICDYGKVYDSANDDCICPDGFTLNANNECVAQGSEVDALCKIYSDTYKQCLQCKDNNQYLNKWLDEFPDECYNECPATTYEDPLINQCRRCHTTCYECTEQFYNNCTACTGTLYFNFQENTCIENCESVGLTKSLTKPNICVIFDADASLINVNTLTPIDVNTFDYIEAQVIDPTSQNYKTLWLFNVTETNKINKELGFDDLLSDNDSPFAENADLTNVRVDLDHTFFKISHKYVFGLKIYTEKDGYEVPVYVWWTLTMNAPPYGGKVTVMPLVGLYNTTTFVMRCEDFMDENTDIADLEYDFYYIEKNTNTQIKLKADFTLDNEVYSNFTVRYYQLEYSNITIYCQVRDQYGAITEASAEIMIVNQKNSELYVLKDIVSQFFLDSNELTDLQLLARSEVLMSLGINPFTDRVPSSYFTTYASSLTGEEVEMTDPRCINGYCNDHGTCEVIDVALTCMCTASYLGTQCFLQKDGYSDLSYYYKKLYLRLIDRLTGSVTNLPINDEVFWALYKLFFAAQNFFQDDTFFDNNLIEFKTYLKNQITYITASVDRLNKLLDLDEFYFNYFYVKEMQLKLTNKINENYDYRNKTLSLTESSNYQTAFKNLFDYLDKDTKFLIQNYGQDYDYTSQHFVYHLKKIDQYFDDEGYFDSLKTPLVNYKPIVNFMNCLISKNPTFPLYLNYIEYLVNPLSFDSTYYPNITSSYISVKIFDSNGDEFEIKNCASSNLIKIYLPFNAYDWLNYINRQRTLFNPANYKLENDPVFRDPILIWDNGTVSDDTAEQRILKYYRYYNIVGLVYTPSALSLYEYTSMVFKNISDSFYLIFETSHLSGFTSMLIPNVMHFVVDGRFFYLSRYKVLLSIENQKKNPVFFIIGLSIVLLIAISLIFYCYDYNYFDSLEMLNFLQKEIIKVHFPYKQIDPGLNDENIFRMIPRVNPRLKKNQMREIRNMFNDVDFGEIKENDEEESVSQENKKKSENNDDDDNNINNLNTKNDNITEEKLDSNSGRKFIDKKNNKRDNKEENDLISKKSGKNSGRKTKRKMNNDHDDANPPKKKELIDDENNISKKKYLNSDEKMKDPLEDFYDVSNKKRKLKMQQQEDMDGGYGNPDNIDAENDFDENKVNEKKSNNSKFTKNSQLRNIKNSYFKGTKNSFDLQSYNSKPSKFTPNQKAPYFLDKNKTKANLISLDKFHNKSSKVKVDNDGIPLDIMNEREEQKKGREAYTKLTSTKCQFLNYNLSTRHILIAPFQNVTLFNNRWKKLTVLVTQWFIMMLIISIVLTWKENITINNIKGMLILSIISAIASNLLVYNFVFLFGTSTYQRRRLYRLVMSGEQLIIMKAWAKLEKIMKCSTFFGMIIVIIIWAANIYITLIFTAVWKVQRSAFIIVFITSLFIDLVIGEIGIELIIAFLYSFRKDSTTLRNLGESLNRLRCYRTLWP